MNSTADTQIKDALEEQLNTEDQLRLDKIATIRAQLSAGSYNISGKDVAEKILTILKPKN